RSRYPLLRRLLGYPDPRIDFESRFLSEPGTYLKEGSYVTYTPAEAFHHGKSPMDIPELQKAPSISEADYLLVELPGLLSHNYPSSWIAEADLVVLVCRANRIWSEADESAFTSIKDLAGDHVYYIINGTEPKEAEALIGELPRRRNRLRKSMKNFLRFQFFNHTQL
ncbi:MAG: hypothetical protein KGM98_08675, partial [Bacteroidota bacterium]|nr:hypothetical protein [Bacteroidota bacterium]